MFRFLLLIALAGCAHQAVMKTSDELLVHPPLAGMFFSIEHHDGQLGSMGDALGRDCVATRLEEVEGRRWSRSYAGDGSKNEDWYGWKRDVLAPFDGVVVRINRNDTLNEPGHSIPGMASFVVVRRADGVNVLLAHLQDFQVKEGDPVTAGQPLGRVGNNGNSWHPHVHVGAWKDKTPLQLRFDLGAMARSMR